MKMFLIRAENAHVGKAAMFMLLAGSENEARAIFDKSLVGHSGMTIVECRDVGNFYMLGML